MRINILRLDGRMMTALVLSDASVTVAVIRRTNNARRRITVDIPSADVSIRTHLINAPITIMLAIAKIAT